MTPSIDQINAHFGVWLRPVKRVRLDENTGETFAELGYAASHGPSRQTYAAYYRSLEGEGRALAKARNWILDRLPARVRREG